MKTTKSNGKTTKSTTKSTKKSCGKSAVTDCGTTDCGDSKKNCK